MGTPDNARSVAPPGQRVLDFDLSSGGYATEWFWPPDFKSDTPPAVAQATALQLEIFYRAYSKYRKTYAAFLRSRGIRR